MSLIVPELEAPLSALSVALGLGLLIGLERERHVGASAGLRTFALVSTLGCLLAMLDEPSGSLTLTALGFIATLSLCLASYLSAGGRRARSQLRRRAYSSAHAETTAPTNEPVAPTNEPVAPTNEPVAPTNEPVAPTNEPTAPTAPTTAPTTAPKTEQRYTDGFTSEVALLMSYALGVASWRGAQTIAVMIAITITLLLSLKRELRRVSLWLSEQELSSILQFGVLSLVVLPALPSAPMGPYGAFNPREVWLMVVLISGLALAGYLALKIVGARYGAAALGLFGGLASSTATTLMFSRHASTRPALVRLSALVIMIANLMVMVRLGVVASVIAPQLLPQLTSVFAFGVAPGLLMSLLGWRALRGEGELPMPEVNNPTELKAALSFGALYGVVSLMGAWLTDLAGPKGLYAITFASGLTDADASSLSALRLLNAAQLSPSQALIAVTLALLANLTFKVSLVVSLGGRALTRAVLPALLSIGVGLGVGLWLAL